MNICIYKGNIATDLELKQTPNGISTVTFRLAVSRPYKREVTDFFNIIAWKKDAEDICRFFHKGDKIAVNGYNTTRQYEKDGVKHNVEEFIVDGWEFCDSKKQDGFVEAEKPKAETVEITTDDLPF